MYKCQVMGFTEKEYKKYVHKPARVRPGCYKVEVVT
jgi:hypothetical protein